MKRIFILALTAIMFSANAQDVLPTREEVIASRQHDVAQLVRARAEYAYRFSPRPQAVSLTYLLGLSVDPMAEWDERTDRHVMELTRFIAPRCLGDGQGTLNVWRELGKSISQPYTSRSYGDYEWRERCNAKLPNEYRYDGNQLETLLGMIAREADVAFYGKVRRHQQRLNAGVPIYSRDNPAPLGYQRLQLTNHVVKEASAKLAWANNNPRHPFSNNMLREQFNVIARACRRDEELSRVDGGELSSECVRHRYAAITH